MSEPETSRPVEKRNFTPPTFGAPIRIIPSGFRRDILYHKTRVRGLSCSVDCVILRLAVSTSLTCDGQTRNDSKYRASIASRG